MSRQNHIKLVLMIIETLNEDELAEIVEVLENKYGLSYNDTEQLYSESELK